jgi:SNF2 family DNA or RNA helicase
MIFKPHNYQLHAIEHIIQREVNPKYADPAFGDRNGALFMDMGLGKTVCTLTALDELMYNYGNINKALIVAPKRVADATWTDEIAKWDHLKRFRVSKIKGTPAQRIKALRASADLYIISRDLITWLVSFLQGACPFDMCVIDESSSFKSWKAGRHKALRKLVPMCKKVIALTGTPIPNGLIDLYPQVYLLDHGARLGKNITAYREAFFNEPFRANNQVVRGYSIVGPDKKDIDKNPSAIEIMSRVKDLCISMKAEDWLAMPEKIEIVTDIKLPAAIYAQYKAFEKEKVLEMLDDQEDVSITSAVALSNKLLQFANGAVYTGKGNTEWVEVHNEKIEALGEAVEAANGSPMLVFYQFQSDITRIQKHLKSQKPYLMKGTKDIADWNAGKIPFALAHPQSFGHGLNMQAGGHLVTWFGRSWGLEFVLQAIARLWRQGQVSAVISNSLACQGTLDYKVLASNADKEHEQNTLMKAVKAIIKEYKK